MKRMVGIAVIAIFACALFLVPYAQPKYEDFHYLVLWGLNPTTCTQKFFVHNEEEEPIYEATVWIRAVEGECMTDSDGKCSISGLVSGRCYQVNVGAPGYYSSPGYREVCTGETLDITLNRLPTSTPTPTTAPTTAPASNFSEKVPIDSNGDATFKKDEIKDIIPKIHFYSVSSGTVTVEIRSKNIDELPIIVDIEVSESIKDSCACITFKVEKEHYDHLKQIDDRNKYINLPDDIELYREDIVFKSLNADWKGGEDKYYWQYDATTPGCSVFKIDLVSDIETRKLTRESIEIASVAKKTVNDIKCISFIACFAAVISAICAIWTYYRCKTNKKKEEEPKGKANEESSEKDK